MLHPLLQDQISSCLGQNPDITPRMKALLNCINDTYSSLVKYPEPGIKNPVSIERSPELDQIETKTWELIRQLEEYPGNRKSNSSDHNWDLGGLLNALSEQIKGLQSRCLEKELKVKELEHINNELDQFAYIVSHDLKAPLRAISNLSQWIEDEISDKLKDDARSNFNLLRSRVERMEGLICAILTYSKSTKIKHKTQITDTSSILKDVVDSLNIPSNILIRQQGSFPIIETESIKLQQVFSNLISNAVKYNDKEEGFIEVGALETEDQCQFYVQDNGPGIEPPYQKKVFMIFQTLEAKDDYESTGIGLSIVKKIIDDNGGKIWIESEKGKGARFVFIWPKTKVENLQKV